MMSRRRLVALWMAGGRGRGARPDAAPRGRLVRPEPGDVDRPRRGVAGAGRIRCGGCVDVPVADCLTDGHSHCHPQALVTPVPKATPAPKKRPVVVAPARPPVKVPARPAPAPAPDDDDDDDDGDDDDDDDGDDDSVGSSSRGAGLRTPAVTLGSHPSRRVGRRVVCAGLHRSGRRGAVRRAPAHRVTGRAVPRPRDRGVHQARERRDGPAHQGSVSPTPRAS